MTGEMSAFQQAVRENIDAVIEYIEETKAESIHWTEKACEEVAANIASAPTQEDRLQYAAYVYWFCPQIRADVIYRALGVKRGDLAKILPRIGVSIQCKDCDAPGTAMPKTRSELRDLQNGKHDQVCEKCAAVRNARHQSYAENVARKRAEYEAEIARLKTMPYREYLQTDHWKTVRGKMLKRSSFSCQLCNAKGRLNVHHRTYERRGCEEYGDLIVLCENCHGKFHDKLESVS